LILSVTLTHFSPPSRVTQTYPSSVPAHSTSGLVGLSARAVPLPILVRVISGETAFASAPRLTDR
jgi:hypothetical protein